MQEIPTPKRITVYEGIDFSFDIEYNGEVALIHWSRLERLTPSGMKKMKSIRSTWSQFFKDMGYDRIYAAIPRQDLKSKRLAMALDFVYLGSKNGAEIYMYGD